MKGLVVAGIGTGIGKTFISAIITEALQADYWKPVQAGNLEFTDTDFVREHISNPASFFHREAYRLSLPMSPHAAASADGIRIDPSRLSIPSTPRLVVIEPAGGLMVPLNENFLNIDLLQQWELPVVLVSQNYLGSINHTLLSIGALNSRRIPVKGIVFNGDKNPTTESFILNYAGLPCIGNVLQEETITKSVVAKYASLLREKLKELL